MSGAGADAVVSVLIAVWYRGAGRPVRWLVTIAGELSSSVASATNSNANSTEPTTAKKARTGITAFRYVNKKYRSGSSGLKKWPPATSQTPVRWLAHLYVHLSSRGSLRLGDRKSVV